MPEHAHIRFIGGPHDGETRAFSDSLPESAVLPGDALDCCPGHATYQFGKDDKGWRLDYLRDSYESWSFHASRLQRAIG